MGYLREKTPSYGMYNAPDQYLGHHHLCLPLLSQGARGRQSYNSHHTSGWGGISCFLRVFLTHQSWCSRIFCELLELCRHFKHHTLSDQYLLATDGRPLRNPMPNHHVLDGNQHHRKILFLYAYFPIFDSCCRHAFKSNLRFKNFLILLRYTPLLFLLALFGFGGR